jgi:hypothetical protein
MQVSPRKQTAESDSPFPHPCQRDVVFGVVLLTANLPESAHHWEV